MDNNQTSFFDLLKLLSKKQKILIVIFFVLIASVVAFIVVHNHLHPSNLSSETDQAATHINITNFDDVEPDIPLFYRKQTEAMIWDALEKYANIPADTKADAEIRQDTYTVTDSTDNFNTSEFVVDIPSLEKSYMITLNWEKGNNNPSEFDSTIECPYNYDVIYKNFFCTTTDKPVNELAKYLPTTIFTDDNLELYLELDTYSQNATNPGGAYLHVDYNSCEENIDNNVKNTVDNWLKEHFVSPEHIDINYYPFCPI